MKRKLYLFLRSNLIYIKNFKKKIFFILNYPIFYVPNIFLKRKKIYWIIANNTDLGGLLANTVFLRDFPKKYKIILWHQSEDIYKNLCENSRYFRRNTINNYLIDFISHSYHSNIIGQCTKKNQKNKKIHAITSTIYSKNLEKVITKYKKKPWIVFNNKEVKELEKKYSDIINKKYSLIISENNASGWANVKRWGYKNMQKVVDETLNKTKWIQIGLTKDKKLKNTFRDLRGKTNIRETLFLVSRSSLVVTTEGFLTHAAGSFDTPCVTIFPGFLEHQNSLYNNTIPIIPDQKIPCLYCHSPVCPYKRPICLESIKAKDVIKATKKILKKS